MSGSRVTMLLLLCACGQRSEYPCGEQVTYAVTSALQTMSGDSASAAARRTDIESGSVKIDRDVLVVRYLGPDGEEVRLTYQRIDEDEIPDSDSAGWR